MTSASFVSKKKKLYNHVQLIHVLYDALYNFGLTLKADISTTNEYC
jgi:hypothetical protein